MSQTFPIPIASSTPLASSRADINNALLALQSSFSGTGAPSSPVAFQWWADTTSNWMKQRNAANTAWLDRWPLNGVNSGPGFTVGIWLEDTDLGGDVPLVTLPANHVITECGITVTQAFNGTSPTISIGTAALPVEYAAAVSVSSTGSKTTNGTELNIYGSGTVAVIGRVASGGGMSTGKAWCWLTGHLTPAQP